MSATRATRRRLVPEIVQSSAMDCGPACLAALLAGFGVQASYGRLREACQTDVDGTSIDALEDVATKLGLDAVQVLVPVDHVLLAESELLPAIVVTRLPAGDNHFMIAWSQRFGRVQVMDPAIGRRWLGRADFLRQLYVHEMSLPAEAWREWAGSDDMGRPLLRRLRALGVTDAQALLARALEDASFRSIAALDAAARMVQAMVDARGFASGPEAAALLVALCEQPGSIPEAYFSARPGADADSLRVRGAVLVHIAGRKEVATPDSPELEAALREPPARPYRALLALLAADGKAQLGWLALGLVLAALGTAGEALLFRALYDAGRDLVTVPQRLVAMGVLLAALLALSLVEVPLRGGVLRLGRHLEVRLRLAFLAKLPRLGLSYLRSRPQSDMAERSHALHQTRELPTLAARLVRVVADIAVTALALVWLAPASSWLVGLLVALALLPPWLVQQALAERELRMRTHAGSLGRFYLDALLGAAPARTHGIERMLRREHEALLLEWLRAAHAERRLSVLMSGLQTAASAAVAIALVASHADRSGEPASVLLLAYWALALPAAALELTGLLRELPAQRNLMLRLLEPLSALEQEGEPAREPGEGPVALALRGVSVVVAGHTVLREVDLALAPGEHVAIVGRSGAGKSTLLGLWLGWVRASEGVLEVDGQRADAARIASLRQATAWVDPAVQLWNESLADNLTYGARTADLGAAIEDAELEAVVARLPEGLGSRLGEAGGLVSGGEGQRVRLGRALARPAARLALLDEPCRGLDREARRRGVARARQRFARATLLCATHDVSDAATFARVLVMEDGRIVEDGTPAELRARPDSRYAALLAQEAALAGLWSQLRRVRLEQGVLVEQRPDGAA